MLNQNPMAVMAQASKLSIPQLQQAIKDGTVPPYIGVPLLQQKIKDSQQAKQAMAAQQPAQPPVAQQVMQQAQGVEGLPSNLPAQGMAQGGIIAFSEGDVVEGDDPFYNAQEASFLAPSTLRKIGKAGLDYTALLPYTVGKAAYKGVQGLHDKNTMTIDPETKQPISVANLRDKPRNELLTGAAKDVAAQYKGNVSDPRNLGNVGIGSMTDALRTGETNPLLADATRGSQAAAQDVNLDDYFGTSRSASVGGKSKVGTGSKGIAGYEIKNYDDSELQNILKEEKNPLTGEPYTYAELADRNRKEQIAAGVDPNVYKKQQADLDTLKEKYAKGSKLEEAMPWFALAEKLSEPTKTGEAPKSFIGNLASGAAAYGKTATEISDKQEARQEKLRTEGNNLALAQNAFSQAQYAGNKADLKDADASVKAARMALANLGVKGVDQQNEMAKTVYEGNIKLQQSAMAENGAIARLGKENDTIKGITKAILHDNPGMPVSEALKRAYETKGAAGIYGADQRTEQAKMADYTKYTTEFGKIMTNYGKQPLSYSKWLDSMGGGASNTAAVPSDINAIMQKYR
jgi:hypothetical protein